jgi:hypothetical protein
MTRASKSPEEAPSHAAMIVRMADESSLAERLQALLENSLFKIFTREEVA